MQEPPWMPRTEEEYQQQLAEDAGPQPDEMVRLLQALDTAESVAQMAAHDRDEALENFASGEQQYAQLLAEHARLIKEAQECVALLDVEANLGPPEHRTTLREVVRRLTEALR